jgi:uncharacterized OB-fold protein
MRIPGELGVSYRYTPGVGNTAFFEALRDRGVFLGSRCDRCAVTYLPARVFCERCLAELVPGIECGPEGELVSWTLVREDVDGNPVEPPVVYGLVRLDGADTVMLHRLVGLAGEPSIGGRVRAAIEETRDGSILDVVGFEPAAGSG